MILSKTPSPITHLVINNAFSRFLYWLFLAIDACFKLKRHIVSSEKKDPGLGTGWLYFVEDKYVPPDTQHMTATKNLDFLACQDWESRMKDVFKELVPQFRILKKNILDYQREIEKAKKVAE